jgi:hypothetical protein
VAVAWRHAVAAHSRQDGGNALSRKRLPEVADTSLSLNAVCPYYTMYPLDFPQGVLGRNSGSGQRVLDPFCGRGTTLFAARVLGLPCIGVDSSPIAAAIAAAKLATATADRVMATAEAILAGNADDVEIPEGEFWRWAYHRSTLSDLCRLRQALLRSCQSPSRLLLRAILLGALHGPRMKREPSYFSNQSPRTFAPKPAYATKFWRSRRMRPPKVDVLAVVRTRAQRFLERVPPEVEGRVLQADSRTPTVFQGRPRFDWVITSPPYYGMRTYIPDQWLRYWFLGGPAEVSYRYEEQLRHTSPEVFVEQLSAVWRNVGSACTLGARLVVRFGGINDRKAEPQSLLKASLASGGWQVVTSRPAGNASSGKRQSRQFAQEEKKALAEYDRNAESNHSRRCAFTPYFLAISPIITLPSCSLFWPRAVRFPTRPNALRSASRMSLRETLRLSRREPQRSGHMGLGAGPDRSFLLCAGCLNSRR